jgi:hypothetical protein
MNVNIGTVGLKPRNSFFWEYLFRIFGIVSLQRIRQMSSYKLYVSASTLFYCNSGLKEFSILTNSSVSALALCWISGQHYSLNPDKGAITCSSKVLYSMYVYVTLHKRDVTLFMSSAHTFPQ